MNRPTKAHLAVLGANFIFGANYAIVKYITPAFIQPFALNVVRVLVSLLMFWSLFLLHPGKAGIRKKDIPRFLACGLTGVAINQLLFIKGLSLSTSIHSALLSLGTPIFITLIAAWLLREGLNLNKIAGLACGIGGAVLLILIKDSNHTGSNVLLGDILILVNAISYAFYLVLVRPLMTVYRPIHVLRWVFTFGALVILPFGWNQFVHTNWQAFQLYHWLALAFIAIGATFLAYLFNIYGIAVIGASATGSYIYTQPVFAAIIAILFTGEQVTVTKTIAAALIFVGVYLVNRNKTTNGEVPATL
ncbi:MAG: DMT family transporter [Sediminibacterium sp.]